MSGCRLRSRPEGEYPASLFIQKRAQIGRQGRPKFQPLTGQGMIEPDPRRMESVPRQDQPGFHLRREMLAIVKPHRDILGDTVELIAYDRVPYRIEVHAD